MSTRIRVEQHETPSEMYDAFARVFGETTADQTSWVSLIANGVEVTFFKQTATEKAPPENVVSEEY